VAFAPAGDDAPRNLLARQRALQEHARAAAPYAPSELAAFRLAGAARCDAEPLLEAALRDGWPFDESRITCPLRIVWGTADELLPWPEAAAGYRARLPHADWVVLEGAGHEPQLERPLETAELVLGFAAS
jgi:pimeloyl-ACP methyl ester carboxylesterase